MNRFFVSCPLGFEQDLIQELREFWPYLLGLDGRPQAEAFEILEVGSGGVEIETALHLGLQINFFSKLAHRVLLRIANFRAKSFPEMKKKCPVGLLFDWTGEKDLRWEIAAAKSKLNNEKRIREVMKEQGLHHMIENEDSPQTLFVRVFQDEFTWSLDTSGEHLHFRSDRVQQGTAPLRETYAAYCLQKLIGETSTAALRGIELIDPMAGSGTFLREAKTLYQPNLSRPFAFQSWRRTPKIFKSAALGGNYQSFSSFGHFVAGDLLPEMTALMKKQLAPTFAAGEIDIIQDDVFSTTGKVDIPPDGGFASMPEAAPSASQRWVIANPPYGERLAADFQPLELLLAIEKKYRPEKIGLLLSQSQAQNLRQKRKPAVEYAFKNSGLAVSFLIF
jgi:putative N6-adenine-specific DNA methylase